MDHTFRTRDEPFAAGQAENCAAFNMEREMRHLQTAVDLDRRPEARSRERRYQPKSKLSECFYFSELGRTT